MHDLEPTWDDFRVFLAAFREGSFSAAARTLKMEQSTVSRGVGRLEAALKVILFERRRDGLVATDAAKILLADAQAAESSFHRLVVAATGLTTEVEGVVRIAVTETMADQVIIPQLHRIMHTYPKLGIQLLTGIKLSNIEKGETDISLRNIPVQHSDFISIKLATLHLAVCASKAYLSSRSYSKPEDLDWIGLIPPAGTDLPENDWMKKYAPEPRLRVSNFVSQSISIQNRLGVGLLTREGLDLYPDLVELNLDLPQPPTFELWLVTHRAQRQIPRVRIVIEFLKQLTDEFLVDD